MATGHSKIPEKVVVPISPQANEQSPKMGLQQNELEPNFTNHSPEISSFTPGLDKPPIYPTPELPFTRRRSVKSKTRFGEPSIPLDSQIFEKIGESPHILCQTLKVTDKECPDDKEIYRRLTAQLSAKISWRMTVKLVVELLVFLLFLSCLICSLTVEVLKGKLCGGLEVWKWFALLLVVFSDILVTGWFVHRIVFLIEWKFLLKKNVVYFTHGLQNAVQVFLWIAVVLIIWVVLFKHDSKTAPKMTSKMKNILDFVTWTIATLLIGSFLWLIKKYLDKHISILFSSE